MHEGLLGANEYYQCLSDGLESGLKFPSHPYNTSFDLHDMQMRTAPCVQRQRHSADLDLI
ncbi:hypothetical protein N7453_002341 [Penicillium expansum]|nr:hypothetical protein N7453_002341 [Penicillium expansum]